MILIGQYDSPFVRRVGITLRLYELPFDHKPWSVFGDFEKIRPYNPLLRVPTLVLGDGTALIDSASILDYLDGQVPEARALFPRQEPARHRALRPRPGCAARAWTRRWPTMPVLVAWCWAFAAACKCWARRW